MMKNENNYNSFIFNNCLVLFRQWLLIFLTAFLPLFTAAGAEEPRKILSGLSGIYTVGTGGDFTTLTQAVNAYNTLSLSGAVEFSLINNSYNTAETFPITINKNALASATNTLTIKPAIGVNATITGSLSNQFLIKILSNFVNIDGSNNGTNSINLTIANSGSTLARTLWFGSTGTSPILNGTVKNCNISAGTTTSNAIMLSDGATYGVAGYFKNFTFQNNNVSNAFYGIYCIGVPTNGNGTGLIITKNDLATAGSTAIQFTGIFVDGSDEATISYNKIGNFIGTDPALDCGITLRNSKNSSVLNNTISNLNYTGTAGFGSCGILISAGYSNANVLVAGNMISNISGDGDDFTGINQLNNPVGILILNPQTGIKIYHNSIALGTVTGFTNTLNKTNAVSACLRLAGAVSVDVRNNIFVNRLGLAATAGYGAMGIVTSTTSSFSALNYNSYFISKTGNGFQSFGLIGGTRYTAFTAWKTVTSMDANSINVNPVFASPTDLRLVPGSNPLLSNAALSIAGFNEDDIDGATRNPFTNDIGCDEFMLPNTAAWIGKSSSDWLTPSNWEANEIPSSTTDVTINGAYPFLPTLSSIHPVRNITLSALGVPPVLTISNGTLQVHGTITVSSGSIDGTNGTLEMSGTVSQTIPAGLFTNNNLKNLIVSNSNGVNGVVLGGALNLFGSLSFTATGSVLNTNDFLTLKSTALETASIGNITGKAINGNVTVERFIKTGTDMLSHGKSWQLLAVPVTGTQSVKAAWQEGAATANANPNSGFGTMITGEMAGALGLGFDAYTPAGASMKVYNSTSGNYTGISNTSTLPIYNPKGYMVLVRGDRSVTGFNQNAVATTLRATGKLITPLNPPPAITIVADKFETVGNPYASVIDFTLLGRTGGIDNTFFVWDPLLPGQGLGGFQAITASNGWQPVPGGTENYPTGTPVKTIQSGQAFFVHATGSSGVLSFSEMAKLNGSDNVFRNNEAGSFLRTFLYVGQSENASVVDGNVIAYNQNYSNNYDGDDVLKLNGGGGSFSILSNDKILAVEAKAMLSEHDTVCFILSNLRAQNYQLRIQPENLPTGFTAYLVDRFLNASTPLDLSSNLFINFSVTSNAGSFAANRFYIHFKQAAVLPVTFTSVSGKRITEKKVVIQWKVENELNVHKYQIERSSDGRQFTFLNALTANNTNGRGVYEYADDEAYSSDIFYRIKSIDLDGSTRLSQVVKLSGIKPEPSFMVYPNPVVEKKINLSLIKMPKGEYMVTVADKLGKIIFEGSRNIMTDIGNWTLKIDPSSPAGTYTIKIISDNGFSKSKQVVIL